jgi:predicted Zn-dependent peptidase
VPEDRAVNARDTEYRKTVLPSGFRVVTEVLPGVRTAALGIWVETGSRFEPARWSGIAHFTEHMLFKGTWRRSAQRIAEEADQLGAQLNAFTDREHTCYYVRVLSEHLPKVTDLLADMLTGSRFDEEAVEKERQVILEEIKMYEDSPDDLVQDLFLEAVWADDALGRPVIGRRETVAALRRPDFLDFVTHEYRAPRVLVAACGDVQHDRVVEQVAELLAPLAGDAPARDATPPPVASRTTYRAKDTEQVHLCLGYPALAQGHPDRYVQSVLDHLAGGGMSSRLFQEVRERRGLVYSIGSFSVLYRDAGAFGVYAGTSPERVPEVLSVTLRELDRLRAEPVSEEELARAKESLKASLMLSLEGTASRMFFLSRSELYFGRRITPDEVLAELEAVTAERVQGLAQRLLSMRPALAAVGPADAEAVTCRALEAA